MPDLVRAYRMMPGCHLFKSESSGWVVASDGGDWICVDADTQQLELLQSLLMSVHCDQHEQLTLAQEQGIERLLDEFIANGFVVNSCQAPVGRKQHCLLLGQGELCTRIHNLLALWFDTDLQSEPDEISNLIPGTLIVCVSDWEQPKLFARLDSLCRNVSAHWYPIYHDRNSTLCGPLFGSTTACRYDDLWRRRLACASEPDLMQEYLRWLHLLSVPPLNLNWQQIYQVAAVILQDLKKFAALPVDIQSSRLGWATQNVVNHADGSLRSHCILPIPVGSAT